MKKEYIQPECELEAFSLTDIMVISLPVHNPTENEVPILTRMKDELAGGDGLSELEPEEEDY